VVAGRRITLNVDFTKIAHEVKLIHLVLDISLANFCEERREPQGSIKEEHFL